VPTLAKVGVGVRIPSPAPIFQGLSILRETPWVRNGGVICSADVRAPTNSFRSLPHVVGMMVPIDASQSCLTHGEVFRGHRETDAVLHEPCGCRVPKRVRSNAFDSCSTACGCKTFLDVLDCSATDVEHGTEITATLARTHEVRKQFAGNRNQASAFLRAGAALDLKVDGARRKVDLRPSQRQNRFFAPAGLVSLAGGKGR
jgi:hypothetical protein